MKTSKNVFYTSDTKQDTKWISFLAVIACFSVVCLHVNGSYYTLDITDPKWIGSLVLQQLCNFGVACFFMISGATLLDYPDRYSTKTYFWKRIKRALFPYLLWSFIFLFVAIGTHNLTWDQLNFKYFWNHLIGYGGINENYWFLPYVFLLYLIIPIYAFIPQPHKDRICLGTVIFGFVGTFMIPLIIESTDPTLKWTYSLGTCYTVVYACLGYLIKKYDFSKMSTALVSVVGIGGLIGMIVGTYFQSQQLGAVDTTCGHNWYALFFLYAFMIATLSKKVGKWLMNKKMGGRFFGFLSKFTFTIYLVHKLVREGLLFGFFNRVCGVPETSYIYIFTAPILIFGIIVLLAWPLRKIPGVKYILP